MSELLNINPERLKTVAAAAFSPGDPVMIGETPAVAFNAGAVGDTLVGAVEGVYLLPATAAAEAAAVGTRMYLNGANIDTGGGDAFGLKWSTEIAKPGFVAVKLSKGSLIPLPALTNLVAAWVWLENREGYADDADMDFVAARVGPDAIGGVNPPTWDESEGAARVDYANLQYFRAAGSAASGVFDFFTDSEEEYAIHSIHKHTDAPGGLETMAATANVSTDDGIRLFRSGTNMRINQYPDNYDETGGGYSSMTSYAARTFTMHSKTSLDASFARYKYHQGGVEVDDDASAHLAGNIPQTYDLFMGMLPGLILPFDGYWKALFICNHYDDDASQNALVKTWYEGLP